MINYLKNSTTEIINLIKFIIKLRNLSMFATLCIITGAIENLMKIKNIRILHTISKLITILPKTIKAIGWVSFLFNMSSVMVFSLFGVYLCKVLNINLSKIALLDGAVEASSFAMKLFSGYISDLFVNRKGLVLTGAIMLFAAKPLEASCTQFAPLFCSKMLERIGNGTQSTPRDALVGDWAPKMIKTSCFGFRQSLAAAGSVVGALLATLLFYKFHNFQKVFWCACIPSLLAVIIVFFFVHNKPQHENHQKQARKVSLQELKKLNKSFWLFLSVVSTYNLAKVSESILIIYVTLQWDLPFYFAPLILTVCHVANCFAALPTAIICDKIKTRENIFIFGLSLFILSDLLFIFGYRNVFMTVLALCCFGVYSGIAQSIFPAKIIELVPQNLKGTGLGIYNLVCALSLLTGASILGYFADKYDLSKMFTVSFIFATVALLFIFFAKSFKLFKS